MLLINHPKLEKVKIGLHWRNWRRLSCTSCRVWATFGMKHLSRKIHNRIWNFKSSILQLQPFAWSTKNFHIQTCSWMTDKSMHSKAVAKCPQIEHTSRKEVILSKKAGYITPYNQRRSVQSLISSPTLVVHTQNFKYHYYVGYEMFHQNCIHWQFCYYSKCSNCSLQYFHQKRKWVVFTFTMHFSTNQLRNNT